VIVLPLLFCYLVGCAVAVATSESPGQPQIPQAQPSDKPDLVSPDAIEGCYDLTLSPWRPNLNIGEDAAFITPPRRVQLLAEHGARGWEAEGFIARSAPGVPPSIHSGSYWLPTGPRSIKIVWTTGFSGLQMNLTLNSRGLRGTAGSFWDFDRERQTADVVAHRVDCRDKSELSAAQPKQTELKTAQTECHEDGGQPRIVAGVGWGPVHIGAVSKEVDAFLGDGKLGSRYSDSYFKEYEERGIQILFESAGNTVRALYFYNGQRGDENFSIFCGETDKNIDWRSSVEDVKKAYGQPTAEFSGTDTGGSWNRIVFLGIDFRFENGRMVRIGVPGR
jgi:hypothetical protein